MAKLRKAPGTPAHLGIYELSGPLDGVSFGNRAVRKLRVRNVSAATEDTLAPLRELPELRRLELEHVSGVDLAPLAGGWPSSTLGAARRPRRRPRRRSRICPTCSCCCSWTSPTAAFRSELALAPSLLNLTVVIDAPNLSGSLDRARTRRRDRLAATHPAARAHLERRRQLSRAGHRARLRLPAPDPPA